MAFSRRIFTHEFKLNAIHLVLNEERPVSQVAKELGIYPKTLHTWLRQHREGSLSSEIPPTREVHPLEAENARLKAALRESQQEVLLLKKFAAYLSTTGLK